MLQRTLAKILRFRGVGLHSGRLVEMEIIPAEANYGIWFQRSDTGAEPLAAIPENVRISELNTTIGNGPNKVSTIEHLMAAFYGLGIDNALVKISAEEVPILDGSAAPFIDLLLIHGTKPLRAQKRIHRVIGHYELKLGDSFLKIEPHAKNELLIHCTIAFNSSRAIGEQNLVFTLNEHSFFDICEARTFCHMRDVETMRANGLALGGSLDNAIVVDDERVLNNEGLRFRDEFVRHKILDCIGDLALIGGLIYGKLTLVKNGHRLHTTFAGDFKGKKDTLWKLESDESITPLPTRAESRL